MHHRDRDAHNGLKKDRAAPLSGNDAWLTRHRDQLDDMDGNVRARRMLAVLACLSFLVAVVALLYLGKLSLDELHEEHATYCSMVKQGLWPDYQHIYKKECQRPHR